MSTTELNNLDDNNNYHESRRSLSEERPSMNSFDEHYSSVIMDDENDEVPLPPLKTFPKPKQTSQIPRLTNSKQMSTSMIIPTNKARSSSLKWNSPAKTPRPLAVVPSISRHAAQGVLVRFFRNGDAHHPGVKVAINELEIKSWEAFLNYLNRHSKLVLSSGGIKHIYSLTGQEIRSINKFQNRQSYIVASGAFIRTNYRHINDAFNDETENSFQQTNQSTNGNLRASAANRWRSPLTNAEQIFILPYSRLNMYESIILNRNLIKQFEPWLHEEVTELLSRYIASDIITHLYAIKKTEFIEVKSFSHLFNLLKVTDTFIGCTEEEFEHSKRYLATMRPDDFFGNGSWPRKPINGLQKYIPKPVVVDAKLSINWVYGYDGNKEQTKTIHPLTEHEILYVIGSVCIIYDLYAKQQRFYTKHTNPITCLNIHRCHSIVASNEIVSAKDRNRVSVHIWDYIKLETITELRKEQFGSDISILSFSPKPDDTFILIVSREKPKVILFVDWKRNEIIYSITTKSDKILSTLFVFDTIEWIACLSQQHLTFYHINWTSKPFRITTQIESEVHNIYTGAVACDDSGERLIVGDKVGSAHIWRLIDNEPKLVLVKESVLENEVQFIVSVDPNMFILANGQNQIKLWNTKLNLIEEIRLKDNFGSIQSICPNRRGLVIGTKMNYILIKETDNEQIDILMRGHTSPAISICCEKNNEYFYSISSDRYLFKWNIQTKEVAWAIKSPQLISCAALHPERNIIVLGTETSKLLIYDTLSSFYVATIVLKVNTGVKSVRFSPDGGDLAIGLQNGMILIFDVLGNGDFQLRTDGKDQHHNVPVTDVIWSVDSSYLLGVYSDNNSNIYSIPSFDIVKGKNLKSIAWHQVVHPIACHIIDKSIVDTHTSAVTLTSNLVLCCGKDGQIRLFRNYYERNIQTLQFGFGFIQNIFPSIGNNTFLLSIINNPTIVEVQVNIES